MTDVQQPMHNPGGRVLLALALSALAVACQDGPTTPGPAGYAGQWSGTTSQGRPIAFTISADEKVTAITVGHNFNGCVGSETFPNLNLDIAPDVQCIPGPCPPDITSYRAFNYSSATRTLGAPSTSLNGLFLSMTRAEGLVAFRDFPGCGSAISNPWTATKR